VSRCKTTCFANHHLVIKKSVTFHRGLDGRRKSKVEAEQIVIDVSKYLKFASPTAHDPNLPVNPRWSGLKPR